MISRVQAHDSFSPSWVCPGNFEPLQRVSSSGDQENQKYPAERFQHVREVGGAQRGYLEFSWAWKVPVHRIAKSQTCLSTHLLSLSSLWRLPTATVLIEVPTTFFNQEKIKDIFKGVVASCCSSCCLEIIFTDITTSKIITDPPLLNV